MTAAAGIYQRMRMDRLKTLARQDAEGYDENATRAYVDRLIDFAAERRYSEWDFRPGWPGM